MLQATLGRAHIARARLGTRIFGIANGEMGSQERVFPLYLVHVKTKFLFGNNEETLCRVGFRTIDSCHIVDIGHIIHLIATLGLLLLHWDRVGDRLFLRRLGLGHQYVASE